MKSWSAFTANDINNDNLLDLHEMKMLIWLISAKKPNRPSLEREMSIMDRDQNGTIDRIEWVSYLAAPKQGDNSLGTMEYYDFEMRDMFESIDLNGDGILDFDELCQFMTMEYAEEYDPLDDARKVQADLSIRKCAMEVIRALKKLAN